MLLILDALQIAESGIRPVHPHPGRTVRSVDHLHSGPMLRPFNGHNPIVDVRR